MFYLLPKPPAKLENEIRKIKNAQLRSFDTSMAYMLVKEASEILEHYRRTAKVALRAYRQRKAAQRIHASGPGHRELRLQRTEAAAHTRRYRQARQDYLELAALSLRHYQQPANNN